MNEPRGAELPGSLNAPFEGTLPKERCLAFVLWHYPAEGVDVTDYHRALASFHSALNDDPPTGFIFSECVIFRELPWLDTDQPAFQDWYVVTDFTSLGALNEAAVAGRRRAPHDVAAALSAEGLGGVYALEAGRASSLVNVVYHWLKKPPQTETPSFFSSLKEIAGRSACLLWRRQMNLGVAPEYCLRCSVELDVAGLTHRCRPQRVVWPMQ